MLAVLCLLIGILLLTFSEVKDAPPGMVPGGFVLVALSLVLIAMDIDV